jgi:replicative DNA helicase
MADEKSGWNLDQLISVAHRSKSKSGADLIIVDYLQQVRVKGSTTKQEQVSKASDELKKLARDLNVPVIVLAQINRESEKSGKPMMPSLANLKDSGSIEQDADVVMILHKEDISLKEVELFVAKNRYGKTGTIKLNHIFAINSYEESND